MATKFVTNPRRAPASKKHSARSKAPKVPLRRNFFDFGFGGKTVEWTVVVEDEEGNILRSADVATKDLVNTLTKISDLWTFEATELAHKVYEQKRAEKVTEGGRQRVRVTPFLHKNPRHAGVHMLRKNPSPSAKTLMTGLGILPEKAKALKEMMTSGRSVTSVLSAADKMMRGYGVEYIASSNDTLRTPDGLEFVNMGDTYDTTLIYDHGKEKYVVSSWGDIAEADMRLPASRRRFAD